MRAGQDKLLDILSGNKRNFEIPVYQRAYSWEESTCLKFLEDLDRVYEDKLDSHFFGSIVYVPLEDAGRYSYTIVDGQQRITTVSLALIAIRNIVKENSAEKYEINPNEIDDSYLMNQYLDGNNKIRLHLLDDDAVAYRALIYGTTFPSNSKLIDNYLLIYNKLKKKNKAQFEGFYEAIKKLMLVNITLEKNLGDDPQLIFESLNSKGEALKNIDKVRNFVLMNVDIGIQKHIYEKYWKEIDKLLFSKPNIDPDQFLRFYLGVKMNNIPSKTQVYYTFKSFFDASKLTSEDFLKDMLDYARYYNEIIYPDPNTIYYRSLINLAKINTETSHILLLYIFRDYYEKLLTDKELCEAIELIESYLIRRIICKVKSNALNTIFLKIGQDLSKRKSGNPDLSYIEILKIALVELTGQGVYPSSTMFKEAFSEYSLYTASAKFKNYFLSKLENSNSKEKIAVEEQIVNGELTIEHIMPQQLTEKWKRELGKNWSEDYLKYRHTPGNLTLVAYNSSFSNKSFRDKLTLPEKGFLCSKLFLNSYVQQCKKWDAAAIRKRSAILSDIAEKIWPPIDPNILKNIGIWKSLADIENITYNDFSAMSVNGKTFRVNTLKKAIEIAIKELSKKYSEELKVYCKNNPITCMTDGDIVHVNKEVLFSIGRKPAHRIQVFKNIINFLGLDEKDVQFKLS